MLVRYAMRQWRREGVLEEVWGGCGGEGMWGWGGVGDEVDTIEKVLFYKKNYILSHL